MYRSERQCSLFGLQCVVLGLWYKLTIGDIMETDLISDKSIVFLLCLPFNDPRMMKI